MKNKPILLVDDDRDMHKLIETNLAELPIDLISARSAPEGLELLSGGLKPRLVLLDLSMPKSGGAEFLEQLKTLPGLTRNVRNVPVLIITSRSPQAEEDVVVNEQVVSFFQKPLDFTKLIALVESYLD